MKNKKQTSLRNRIILFEFKKYKCILDCLEKNKIEIPFQCKNGFCGICKIQLKKGKIFYYNKCINCFTKDEILPCSCIPKTNITILINNINYKILLKNNYKIIKNIIS